MSKFEASNWPATFARIPAGSFKIFWLLDLDHRRGVHHGGTLRYVKSSEHLVRAGHKVAFVVVNGASQDRCGRREYLEALKNENRLSDYFEIEAPGYSRLRSRVGRLFISAPIRDRLMAPVWREFSERVLELVRAEQPDVCILSDRHHLFLSLDISRERPVIIDWCDSWVLAGLREIALSVKTGCFRRLPMETRDLLSAYMDERFYGRIAAANIVVSPADRQYLNLLNRRPGKNRILYMGVDCGLPSGASVERIPGRIIFTGSMDFPPNYRSALWFIDRVMPILERSGRKIEFVVAGTNPIPELVAKARGNVVISGFVPDIRQEIARSQIYVAPLICGSGFKIKIVEALAAGTFIVGTRIAAEFLPEKVKSCLLVADNTPESLAGRILEYLENPEAFAGRLAEAVRIVGKDFTWERQAAQLMGLIDEVHSTWQASTYPAAP